MGNTVQMTRAKIYKIGSVYSRVFRSVACDDSEYTSKALNIFRPYLSIADRYARTVQNSHKFLNKFVDQNSKEIEKINKEIEANKVDEAKVAQLQTRVTELEAAREVEETKSKKELREFENDLVDVPPFVDEKELQKFLGEKKIYKLSAGDLYDLYVFDKHLDEDEGDEK
jgi:hypothetical protein